MSQPLRIVFAGTPAFALPTLERLVASKHQVIGCYTQPDRPSGRGQKYQASVIKTFALKQHIPVFQPQTLKTKEAQVELERLKADVMVVAAYGLILPKAVLEIPTLGCVNVHTSLLPRWRGASPVQSAIYAGDKTTGVTVMQMDEGLDSGDILAQVSTDILASETSESLLHRLAQLAPPLLLDTLEQLSMGQHSRQKQNELEVTHAHKITKEDAKINWQREACEIDQQIRAYIPWPLAYTIIEQQPVKVHQALILKKAHTNTPGTIVAIEKDAIHIACGKDILVIREWQWPNQKKMSLQSFLNGHKNPFVLGQILQ